MKSCTKALILTITAGVALLMAGCADGQVAAVADPPTVTVKVTTTQAAPPPVTIIKTAPPITVTKTAPPVTVTSPVTVTVTSQQDPTTEIPPTSDAPVVSAAPTDNEGNLIAVIHARDPETPGAELSCDDVLGSIETLGGQPGGCEYFDQDRWNEILTNDPNAFNAFNQSSEIGSFRGSEFSTVERIYVALTAYEELWINQASESGTQQSAAFATMKPIIAKWFDDRAEPGDIIEAIQVVQDQFLTP